MSFTPTPIGQFNHRIDLERPKDPAGRGDTGEVVKEYLPYASVWAAFRTLSGNERIAAQQVAATLTHEITIGYRSDVKADHRIVMGTRIFDIKDPRDVDERHIELRMRCTEVTA